MVPEVGGKSVSHSAANTLPCEEAVSQRSAAVMACFVTGEVEAGVDSDVPQQQLLDRLLHLPVFGLTW